MAISYVWSGSTGGSSTSGTFSTPAITGTSNQNDMMIVVLNSQIVQFTAVTDNYGNVYTKAYEYNYNSNFYLAVWYCYQNSHWGSNPTFGLTCSQGGWPYNLTNYDFSGLANSAPESHVEAAGTFSATMTGPSASNANVPDLILSAFGMNINQTSSNYSWSNPINNTSATQAPIVTQALIKTAGGGANTPSFTSSQTSGWNYGATTVVFTGAGATAAGSLAHNLMMMGIGS